MEDFWVLEILLAVSVTGGHSNERKWILTVIKRVFVGLVGCTSGGRFERSSLRELRDDDRDLVFGLEGSDKPEPLVTAVAIGLRLGLSIIYMLFNLCL